WVKSVSLSTAILAVFAAVGALQAGRLVNEAMMDQIKASDTWNEYQASREKTHMYTIALNTMVDSQKGEQPRAKEYKAQLDKEDAKQNDRFQKAGELEAESKRTMKRHERFAYEVAMLQVSIALGAVSALTKVRSVWLMSMALGLVGIVLFVIGFFQ
ncbi:MAG TPA: DUF4337 domain-containing protein, partial [Fimbriimonadaceae bacterium]|nr:DUF4337 domain-containing protein [Fimbriimonadaceae bacterium]